MNVSVTIVLAPMSQEASPAMVTVVTSTEVVQLNEQSPGVSVTVPADEKGQPAEAVLIIIVGEVDAVRAVTGVSCSLMEDGVTNSVYELKIQAEPGDAATHKSAHVARARRVTEEQNDMAEKK